MTNQAMRATLDHIQKVLATHNNAVSAKLSADWLRHAQAASDLPATLAAVIVTMAKVRPRWPWLSPFCRQPPVGR